MSSKLYISRFLKAKVSPFLLPFFQRTGNPVKEITESYGIFNAARTCFPEFIKEDTVDCFVIGDGNTSRTAAMFAFFTKWQCYSIDPKLNMNYLNKNDPKTVFVLNYDIKRLYPFNKKIEDFSLEKDRIVSNNHTALLIFPHSHASFDISVRKFISFYKEIHAINMPCCVNIDDKFLNIENLFKFNTKVYKDVYVNSPQNTIYVFNNLQNM